MKVLKELLKDKNTLLKGLKKYISEQRFSDEEEDISEILAYVEKKQDFIDELNELESKIKAYSEEDVDYKEVKDILEENNSLIHNIGTMEKRNISIMNSLKDKLKLNVKGAKIQQQYTVSYSNYAMDIRGSSFDSKQ